MRIHSLSIHNKFLGWGFDNIEFNANLTLLVGASGVGKTQILKAINYLKKIVNGDAINGFCWKIEFSISSGQRFVWEGEYDVVEEEDDFSNKKNTEKFNTPILSEELRESYRIIFSRSNAQIRFNNSVLPKLSLVKSVINLLNEEQEIREIYNSFRKIIFKDFTERHTNMKLTFGGKHIYNVLKDKYKTIDELRNANEDLRIKLYLASSLNIDEFFIIKNKFISIFPQIEDVKVDSLELEFGLVPVVYIKEKGVEKWIRESRMSSGMLRTFIHLCEIYLSNDGSVILIDEFENSLGVNCMDVLADDLIHENKTLQFIVTSHHPYIINNIPYEYWKIVTRHGGNIMVGDAASYNLGKSKQNAFMQLTKILEKQS
jgi:predicted ATPase